MLIRRCRTRVAVVAGTLVMGITGGVSGCGDGAPSRSPSVVVAPGGSTGTGPDVTLPAPTAPPPTTAPPPSTTLATTTTAAPLAPDLLAGGMVLCSFSGPTVPDAVLARLRAGHAAGLLLYQRNLASEAEAADNAVAAQAAAMASPLALPAIVATDQEGGVVARIDGPPSDSAAAMGTWPPADVEAEGLATAELLRRWGVNTDLAPVADVARPGTFEARSRRSFGGEPGAVADAASAFVTGLRRGGVAATLKHFPGLGAASANTDHDDGVVPVAADELATVDLVPFRAAIGAGAELVMVSSASYPALAPGLALVSPEILDGLLRGQLGFRGVTISDALDASAVAAIGSPGEAAVLAAAAGVDLLIAQGPGVCGDIHQALVSAIADGRLPVTRAQQAFDRVAALRHGLQPAPPG